MVCTALWFMVQDEVVPYSCYWFLFKDNPHLNSVEVDFYCLAGKPGTGYECGFWLSRVLAITPKPSFRFIEMVVVFH